MSQGIFLAGADSLKLTREARRSTELALEPAPDAHRSVPPMLPNPGELVVTLPEVLLPVSASDPLELTFFERRARSQSRLIRSRCLLSKLPEQSFHEVVRTDGRPWLRAGGEPVRLFAEAPGLSLIRMSQRLEQSARDGALSPSAAFFRLLALAMEPCGSYARDPRDLARCACVFDVPPLTTAARLRAFLGEAHGIKGVVGARRAAAHAMDGSGSPEETLLACALRLPFELGGIAAPPLVLNEPLSWPEEVAHLVEHRRMRPDISFPGLATALEYNGLTHMDRSSFEEDQRRIRDYQLCGISVFPATYRDVSTPHALASYLARVAHSIDAHGLPGYERRVLAALADDGMTHMRRVLLSQMLPERSPR